MSKHYDSTNSTWEYYRIPQVNSKDKEYLRKMIEEHPNLNPEIIRESWVDELLDRGAIFEVHILRDLRGKQIAQVICDQNGEVIRGKRFDTKRGVLVDSKY